MANKKNLASGTLVAGITTSSTTLSVYVGNGNSSTIEGVWPTTPFFITVMPPSPDAGVANSLDSEVMQVTAVSSDSSGNTTLTVTRAQKSTTAKSFDEGSVVTNAIYPDDVALVSGTVGSLTSPVYVNNGEIQGCKTAASGANWNIVPKVGGDGVMEIGRYLDFHNTNTGTSDNTLRIDNYQQDCIQISGLNGDVVLKNGNSGTFSLRDVCTNAFQNGTDAIKVTAGSDDWSKDFDNIVFPKNFGAAILVSGENNIWANNPTGSTSATEHWYLVQEQFNAGSNTYARQYCSEVNNFDGNHTWFRERHSGSWSVWERIAESSELDNLARIADPTTSETPTPWIGTTEIEDNAITNAKIASGAVTSDKINFTTFVYGPERLVGTLSDNTPIYEQVITGTLPNISLSGVTIATVQNFGSLISLEGWANTFGYWTSLNSYYGSSGISSIMQVEASTGKITIYATDNFKNKPFSVRITYTKSS